jgi:hypothetical protein
MSSRRVLTATAVFAAVLTLSAASIGASGGSRQSSHPGLALSGNVAGLLPGQQARLTITVKNRLRRVVHLRSVTTAVHAAARGCAGANLVVARYRGRLRIGPGRRLRLTVSVRMRRDSPNSCQGKVFPLVFRGQASA